MLNIGLTPINQPTNRLHNMGKRNVKNRQVEPPSTPPAITLELLRSTPESNLDYVVFNYVESYVFAVPDRFSAALARLPIGLRYCWLIEDINYQVLNGGFHQFFFNSSGVRALETLDALRAIGAKEPANVLKKAIMVFERKFGRPAD